MVQQKNKKKNGANVKIDGVNIGDQQLVLQKDEIQRLFKARIEDLLEIQGKRGFWFCGAYQRYGFHEDGLMSAVNIVEQMGEAIPWK